MPNHIFDLSSQITLLPIIHGSGDFSLETRKRILSSKYDCLAIPIPPAFEDDVEKSIELLPSISVVVQGEGGIDKEPSSYTCVPIDPCQPIIAGIRTAQENGIPRAYIDLEVDLYEEQTTLFPDPYALKKISLEKFSTALLTGLPNPAKDSQRTDRIQNMAYQLHLLELDYDNILCLCGIADWPWIRNAYLHRLPYPKPSPPPWTPEIFRVNLDSLYFVLGELPFITHLYEHRRAELFPDETLAIDAIKALLLESRKTWITKHNHTHHWLSPQTLSQLLRYVRNLTLLDSRMSPDLYNLALAAKQIAGDDFSISLIETARVYPPQTIPSSIPEISIGQGKALFSHGIANLKNRLLGTKKVWRTLPLKPSPSPDKKQTWQMQWDPYRQCSYPKEDDKIESFNIHIREQAKRLITETFSKTEKFTTSLKDGLDIRETLRNWHTNEIYVKEIPPSRGNLEIVVFLFESPIDSTRYPWHTTWYAEHDKESTLCFFATNFLENIIGPGIGQAVYGGCSLLFPPRQIPDIWKDNRFGYAQTLEERLIAAALYHSQEKRVVLVAPNRPPTRWLKIARRYKKQILYIPLKRFSLQTLDRLRHFHVLNGQEVRSYAAKFIQDFR